MELVPGFCAMDGAYAKMPDTAESEAADMINAEKRV